MLKPSIATVTLFALLVLIVMRPADAQHYHAYDDDFTVIPPGSDRLRPVPGDQRRSRVPLGTIIPPDWQLQPAEPNVQGKRFTSPDGTAWLMIYQVAAEGAVADHMKSIAFAAEGEIPTYIQAGREWIAAAGFNGSRMFYRRAILACDGKVWQHVVYEYPREMRERLARFLLLAAQGLHERQGDECDRETTNDGAR